MQERRSIGVFDSGLGGLTVLKKLVQTMPKENYLYFGDTARIPYGEKTKEELLIYVREILDWFSQNRIKAVLMACNTSSAITLDIVKKEYDFPIFGLINPTASYIGSLDIKKVGIIATSATANSKAYSNAIKKIDPSKEIFEIGCPGLVEIVEQDKTGTIEAKNLIKSYIDPLIENKTEKIILGCTHYPYLSQVINELTGKSDLLINPADFIVSQTQETLAKTYLLNDLEEGTRHYYVSSNPERFVEIGNKFFSDCKQAKTIDLSLLKL